MQEMKSIVQALSKQGPSAYSSQLKRSVTHLETERSSHILCRKIESTVGDQNYISAAN